MVELQLETSRLVLSPVAFGEVGALRALLIHPEVRRWLCDGRVLTEADVRAMVRESRERFRWHCGGFFAMRSRNDGSLVGLAGLKPAMLGGLELVSALWPSHWRSGLAAEACRAVVRDAFERVGVPRVLAATDAPNFRSLALIQALGFRQIAVTPGTFGSIRWFSLDRSAQPRVHPQQERRRIERDDAFPVAPQAREALGLAQASRAVHHERLDRGESGEAQDAAVDGVEHAGDGPVYAPLRARARGTTDRHRAHPALPGEHAALESSPGAIGAADREDPVDRPSPSGTLLALPQARELSLHDEGAARLMSVLVRNAARNMRRRLRRSRAQEPIDDAMEIPTDAPSVDALLAAAEAHVALLGCVRQLAEVQRLVVTMRVLEELSPAEVARTLGLTPVHVGVLLYRAKRELMDCMERGRAEEGSLPGRR